MRSRARLQRASSLPDSLDPDNRASSKASQKARSASVFTSRLWRMLAGVLLLASLLTGCGPSIIQPTLSASKATPTAARDQATLYAGFAAGYLVALQARDGALRWRIKGYTWSPVLANGILYTESGAELLAVRPAADGLVTIWRTSLDTALASAPVLRAGILYVTTLGLTTARAAPNGSTYSVDASTGHILWRFQAHGSMGISPVVTPDAIYVSAETADGVSTLFALNRLDGSLRWHKQRRGYDTGLAVLGGTLFAGSTDIGVAALRISDGATVWSYTTPDSVSITVQDAGDASIIYAASFDGNLYALRASDGSRVWVYQADAPLVAPVAMQDGLVYVASGNGYVAALDAATGKARWRTCVDTTPCETSGASIRFTMPLVAQQTIYVGVGFVGARPFYGGLAQVAGGIYALDANTGRIRWQYQSGIVGAEMGTPTLVNG